MQILNLSEYEKLNDLYLIWNAEYGNIYPITAELFDRNIENIYMKASYVVVSNEKLIGFVIGKGCGSTGCVYPQTHPSRIRHH